jgi:hypothetical protein
MLLVSQGFGMIRTCLLVMLKGKGTNANTQSSKIRVVAKQQWACQPGPSLQRRQQVLLRVYLSAKSMYSDLMAMTTMMRAKMRIVITMSLNLKPNANHVCLHKGNRKLVQSGVEQWQRQLVLSYLGAANGSKQPSNGTTAMQGAPSGENGIFVGSTVGVTRKSKAMDFVRLTVAESDVSMQVGVTKQSIAMGFVGLTVAESDVSMQVDVERVL